MKKKKIEKKKQKPNPPGQPTKFCKEIKSQMKKLYLLGLTDVQVADFVGVKEQTINNWKKAYPKFFESLKNWKKEADLKIEKTLRQRALGYEFEEIHTEFIEIGESQTPAKKVRTITKQVIPDVTAQIFWLKNRKPGEWRDKNILEHEGLDNVGITLLAPKERKNGNNADSVSI